MTLQLYKHCSRRLRKTFTKQWRACWIANRRNLFLLQRYDCLLLLKETKALDF